MGFLDKAAAAAKQAAADAKKAANDFQAANPNLMSGTLGTGGGAGDRLLRDLGVLAYLDAQGRPGSEQDKQRILGELSTLEPSGGLNLTLSPPQPAPGTPPPPPGAVRNAYEASQSAPPPPPPAASPLPAPDPLAAPTPVEQGGPAGQSGQEGLGGGQGTGAPPPPPSWS